MRLRLKIMSGFLVLALTLLVAGVWSLWELRSVGSTVQELLDDNYQSIHAASMMLGALQQEDNAVLLLMLGRWDEGRATMAAADSAFRWNLSFAEGNITVPGEEACLDSIGARYAAYRGLWERPIVDTAREGNVDWYWREVHQAYLAAREPVERLAELNQQSLYDTARQLQQRGSRAAMPGLVAMAVSLLVTVVFSYFVQYYVVGPIVRVARAARAACDGRESAEVEVETRDELYELATSVGMLCRASAARGTRR